jgi:pimeloyl-ACP methyl ester carboxylesterase
VLGAELRLATWLGPWAGARVPGGISRARVTLAPRVAAYVYRSRRARGVYLVTPGLHYLGPDDPRLDRFCRILAHAGFVVVAPLLPDFLSLVIAETTTADLAVAFDHACALAHAERLPAPVVFSISFGSRPAIELCAGDAGRRASALVLFGGFCDFDATVRFAITGRAAHVELAHDPLNAPVVHLNLLRFHDRTLDHEAVAEALRAMVEATWGKPEQKEGDARAVHALRIGAALDARSREFFLAACGLRGARASEALLEEGLAASAGTFDWVDPRPHLARVAPPVVIVHGRGDDVIPWTEAKKLAAALPPGHPCETILTGLYGHTGASLPAPRALAAELRQMARVVRVLARGGVARDGGPLAPAW